MTHHDADAGSETEAALHERVAQQRFVMLTTVAEDGDLVSHPMTVQEVDGWTLRMITQQDSAVARQSNGLRVNICAMDSGNYWSLSASGALNDSVQDKQELWGRLTEAYAGEPEDPANVILELTASRGEYWDSGNALTRVLGFAKAALTKQAPAGENGSVDL